MGQGERQLPVDGGSRQSSGLPGDESPPKSHRLPYRETSSGLQWEDLAIAISIDVIIRTIVSLMCFSLIPY